MAATPIVFIVDDDLQVRDSLTFVVQNAGMEAKAMHSAEAFLSICDNLPNVPKCLVLDVCMPGISGLGLQQMLKARNISIPIIMMSGCAEIPMAVQAMSAGAIGFLEKPFSCRALLAQIREAISQSVCVQQLCMRKDAIAPRVNRLSVRQREVLYMLIDGKHSKQIASELGIGEKTVAKHRAVILEKMEVDNVVELVRLMTDANYPLPNVDNAASPVGLLPMTSVGLKRSAI